MSSSSKGLDKFFKISERGSNVSTEVRAGITTFITMAYILPVNMSILGAAGLEQGAVFMATALAAVLGTVLMGLWAGLPFAQAPGMGLNAFFAFSVVIGFGVTPAFALAAVLVEGLLFLVLSLTGVRTALLKAIPKQLRLAISAGIGLFIMFIGLQNAGIIVADGATLVAANEQLGFVTVALAIIGLALTIILYAKKVKGALLIGILATWALGMISQGIGWYTPDAAAGMFSLIPEGILSKPQSLAPTFGICFDGFAEAFASGENIGKFVIVVLTFLYVDIFDTLGTFAGVSTKAKIADENGNFPGANRAFAADAIATTAGAILGTSTVTTFVESAAGVEEGGRTGLTSLVTAAFFLLAIPFFPIFAAIPGWATAPALIVVGIMMCEPLSEFEWANPEALIPGVITIIFMVTAYSIAAGIMWGVLAYLIVKTFTGKAKDIPVLMWVMGVLFLAKMFIMPLFF